MLVFAIELSKSTVKVGTRPSKETCSSARPLMRTSAGANLLLQNETEGPDELIINAGVLRLQLQRQYPLIKLVINQESTFRNERSV